MANSSSATLLSSLITANFSGLSAPGAVSIPGLVAGDIIVNGSVNGTSVWNSFAPLFEPVVSVTGQLQQLSGNLVGPAFTIYLIRGVL